MTDSEKEKFLIMKTALFKISECYLSTEKLRKNSQNSFGLDYTEALEMAYENMQEEAASAYQQVNQPKEV